MDKVMSDYYLYWYTCKRNTVYIKNKTLILPGIYCFTLSFQKYTPNNQNTIKSTTKEL